MSKLNTIVPELIELSVYRDTFLTQERTDKLCALIWQEQPEVIADLSKNAERKFPENRDIFLTKPNTIITEFIRKKEKVGEIKPISLTAMVDLLYEIDRRIIKAKGLKEIIVVGEPITPTLEGPFPELIDMPIYRLSNGEPKQGITQEKADRLCSEIYKKLCKDNPEVIYAYCELKRRFLKSGEPTWFVFNFIRNNINKIENVSPNYIDFEFSGRLIAMSSAKNKGDN